jgi:hypothetical protein
MAIARKDEARALDAGEQELVARSYHPEVQALSDAELAELVRLVRERRDRAQRLAAQQAREMRGKGAPRGAAPASDATGTRIKVAVLAKAVRRLNAEAERRAQMAATATTVSAAQRALALKQAAMGAGAGAEAGGNSRALWRERQMRQAQRPGRPTSAELVRPMERGRQRKAAAVAQARRDGR